MCKTFSIRWWLVLSLLVSQANYPVFAQTKRVKLGETFTLRSGETAETEDAKLTIRASVGRTISESGEVVFVKLQVRLNKSKRLITISERKNRTATVGNFIIKLVAADSFGETNCQLKISRKK